MVLKKQLQVDVVFIYLGMMQKQSVLYFVLFIILNMLLCQVTYKQTMQQRVWSNIQRQVKEITTGRGFLGLYPVYEEEIFLLSHILQIFVVMLDVEFIVLLFCFM